MLMRSTVVTRAQPPTTAGPRRHHADDSSLRSAEDLGDDRLPNPARRSRSEHSCPRLSHSPVTPNPRPMPADRGSRNTRRNTWASGRCPPEEQRTHSDVPAEERADHQGDRLITVRHRPQWIFRAAAIAVITPSRGPGGPAGRDVAPVRSHEDEARSMKPMRVHMGWGALSALNTASRMSPTRSC